MSADEWESLCDGCGKCCLVKLEDEDTSEVHYTDIACRYLDEATCQCTSYADRINKHPDCIELTPGQVDKFHWLPSTCAYRLIAEGKDLPLWHHLVSKDAELIHRSQASVRGKTVSEKNILPEAMQERIIRWVE